MIDDVINSPYISGGRYKGTISLIWYINLQVCSLYNTLCPTIYHHYNCPYIVSICERGIWKTPLKDTISPIFRWRIKQLKSVHAHYFLHSIFSWKFYIVKKTLLTLSTGPFFSLLTFLNMVTTIVPVGKSGSNCMWTIYIIYTIFIVVNMSKSGRGDYPLSWAPLTFWQNQVF